MAWIYLAESEDSHWHYKIGSDQLPIVKETNMRNLCFCSGCGTVHFLELLSGPTLPHSYLKCCPDQSISFTEDSHVRISALQEMELAWKESAADFSLKSSDYVAIFDPDSFSWKTSQLSLFGGLTEFYWNSLRSGMIRDGRLYQPQQLEPPTSEKGGGYLPTPMASMAGTNGKSWDEETQSWINGKPSLNMMASKNLWPTPTASEASRGDSPSSRRRNTPNLSCQVNMQNENHGGHLNPQWVEWLMGYPYEWTALEDWATQWFRSQRRKHS